jgi:hypothetical protein
MSKTDLKGYLDWLQGLHTAQGVIEKAGVTAGSNAANRSKKDRNQMVLPGSKSFTVRGGRIVEVQRILNATELGVKEEMERTFK